MTRGSIETEVCNEINRCSPISSPQNDLQLFWFGTGAIAQSLFPVSHFVFLHTYPHFKNLRLMCSWQVVSSDNELVIFAHELTKSTLL